MKKIILILSVIGFALNSYGQKIQLDSSIYFNKNDKVSKKIFSYNAKKENDTTYNYTWDKDSSKFFETGYNTKIFNSKGLVLTSEEHNWFWAPKATYHKKYSGGKIDYIYDKEGNVLEKTTSYKRTDTIHWTIDIRSIWKYDSKGRQIYHRGYKWNGKKLEGDNGAYTEEGAYNRKFDIKGNLVQYISYQWNFSNSIYGNNSKKIYAYDNAGNQLLNEAYKWNKTKNIWEGDNYNLRGRYLMGYMDIGKRTQGYNIDNKRTMGNDYFWDTAINQWKHATKFITKFNSEKRIYYVLDQYLAKFDNKWRGSEISSKYNLKGDIIELKSGSTFFKYNYTYNSKGNIAISISSRSNDKIKWFKSMKAEFGYDAKDSMISKVSYQWKKDPKDPYGQKVDWIKYTKKEQNFDTKGHKISTINSQWKKDSYTRKYVWAKYTKKEIGYDINGNIILVSHAVWDRNKWITGGGYVRDYFVFNYRKFRPVMSINQGFSEHRMPILEKPNMQFGKHTYKYDSKGNTVLSKHYDGNKLEAEVETSYDKSGNIIVEKVSLRDVVAKRILPFITYTYKKDKSGISINSFYETHTRYNRKYYTGKKRALKFDANNNLLISSTETYNINTKKWGKYSYTYVYDTNFFFKSLKIKNYPIIYYTPSGNRQRYMPTTNNILLRRDLYSNSNLTYKDRFYYSIDSSASHIKSNGFIKGIVYPNPFANSIVFKLPVANKFYQLTILDYQGRKVLSKKIISGEEINTLHLANGLYFYKLTNQNSILSGKLIKQ